MDAIIKAIGKTPSLATLPLRVEEGYLPALLTQSGGAMRALGAAMLRRETDRPIFVLCTDDSNVGTLAADLEALKAVSVEAGRTVADKVTEKSGQTGEKVEMAYYARIEAPYCHSYVHFNKKLGTILGFNKVVPEEVAHAVAMQATAMAPIAIDVADCPADVVAHERQITIEAMKQDPKNAKKPDAIIEKIVMGGIAKYFKEICLLQQPFVKDDKVSVEDHIAAVAKQIGASIKLVGYTRFEKGEGIEKRQDDLAEEVAKLVK